MKNRRSGWVSSGQAGFRKEHQFNGSTVPWSEGPHAPRSPDRDEAPLEQSESKPRLNKSLSGLRRKNPFLPDEFVIDLFRCESLIELASANTPSEICTKTN